MSCESKKISELPGVTRVYPNDLIPIVQDGTNKYTTVKDLIGRHDHSGDNCCCSQALSKAITALDFSRTAVDLANKAYDKTCLIGTRLAVLELKVAEHDTLICNIRSQITLISNQLEALEGNLKVTIVSSSDADNITYKVLQGSTDVGTILVPKPTTNLENGFGKPADAYTVWLAIQNVSKNLTFVAGKFEQDGDYYNGKVAKTLKIPTRTSHLINDGDSSGNPFLTGVKGYDGRTAPVTNGVADLSRIPIGLDDLKDVDAANPRNGDILYYDGTNWINVPFEDILEQNCLTIIDCIGGSINFDVAPLEIVLAYNKRNTGGTPFSVTSDGAWKIRKKSGGSEFSANLDDDDPQSENGEFLVTVNSDNNTGVNREAVWTVYPKVTIPGHIEPIDVTIIQKTSHTITYVITGSGTASDISGLPSGNTAKVNDGSNYTKSGILPKAGYEITSVTFNPNTRASYNTSTGKVSITRVETDVEITIEVNPSTAPLHKITYVIPNYDDKIDITPGDIYVNNGVTYTEDLAGAINDSRYEITGVTINPSSNGTYNNGELTIPDTVTTDTEVTINIAPKSSGLSVNPQTINVVKDGTTQTTDVNITNSCATNGILITRTGVPSGITTTLNSAKTKLTVKVANSVANGTYVVTLTNDCGDTATVTINVSDAPTTVLTVQPDEITVPEGLTTTNTDITVSTTCTGGLINVRNLPTGITAVEENGHLKVTVQSTVSAGTYLFEVYDNCGNTHTVTVNITPAYFDEKTNNFAFFSPKGIPVDGSVSEGTGNGEHWDHTRDGLRDGYEYSNGIRTYIDSTDNSWNITVPYTSENGLNNLLIYYTVEYITDGNNILNPKVRYTSLEGSAAQTVNTELINNNGESFTLKMKLNPIIDLTTDSNQPIDRNNYYMDDDTTPDNYRAAYKRVVGLLVKVLNSDPNYYLYPLYDNNTHYIINTWISLDNYSYDSDVVEDIAGHHNITVTSGLSNVSFYTPVILPLSEFNYSLDTSETSDWITNVDFTNEEFDVGIGEPTTGQLVYNLNWNNPTSGSRKYTITVNRQ